MIAELSSLGGGGLPIPGGGGAQSDDDMSALKKDSQKMMAFLQSVTPGGSESTNHSCGDIPIRQGTIVSLPESQCCRFELLQDGGISHAQGAANVGGVHSGVAECADCSSDRRGGGFENRDNFMFS